MKTRMILIVFMLFMIILFIAFIMSHNTNKETLNQNIESQPIKVNAIYYEALKEESIVETQKIPKMPEYSIKLDKELQTYLWELCYEQEIAYELVLAMIKLESNFNRNDINRNTNSTVDRGLCQINSKYEKYHCELVNVHNFDPYNPYKSLELCVKLLSYYRQYWQNKGYPEEELIHIVPACYNLGLPYVENAIKQKGYINATYSRKVMELKKQLEQYNKFLD